MILISNKKYKEVLKERNLYQKYYYDEQRLTGALRCEIATLKDEIKEYRDSNEYIINMVDDFKRKYLEEQQKRLFLAELIKKLEGESEEKPVTCRECKYLVYEPSYVHCTKGHNKSMSSLEYSCGEGEKRV